MIIKLTNKKCWELRMLKNRLSRAVQPHRIEVVWMAWSQKVVTWDWKASDFEFQFSNYMIIKKDRVVLIGTVANDIHINTFEAEEGVNLIEEVKRYDIEKWEGNDDNQKSL